MVDSSKFWKPKSNIFDVNNLLSKFKKGPAAGSSSMSMPTENGKKSPFKFRMPSVKKLGKAGIAVAVVFGVIAALSFIFVIKPAFVVINQANKLKADKDAFDKAMKTQDIDGVLKSLDSFKSDIQDLRKVRDNNFGWARNLPGIKDYYSDSEHFINAGIYAVEGLTEFVNISKPFAEAAGFKFKGDIKIEDPNAPSGFADAFAGWVKVMPEVASKMDPVIESFDKVGEEVSKVDASRYPESINKVAVRSNIEAAQMYLTQAKEFGPDIKDALTIIPSLLSVGTPVKRYAIVMQNDAELRATGGFITNFATFKVQNAMLASDFTSNDAYSIDEYIATTDTIYTSPFPKPYPPYRDFLKLEHTYSRDANFSPDFVTAMDKWKWYYDFAGRIGHPSAKPVNGIVAIDTQVLSALLNVTGPVALDGVTYDSNNVVLELEKIASLNLREQSGRKRVLGNLMQEMLIKMYKSERNLWPKFVETAVRLAAEKHIQGYILDDVKAQALLEKYNFSGRIPAVVSGDYSFVVSTNLSGDKNNLFVTREVNHKVNQVNGKWVHEVSITSRFNEPKPGYEPLVTTYREWTRVYAPAGSTLISLDGSDAKTESDLGEERGKVYFAGHFVLNKGETKTLTFKYNVPDTVVKDNVYTLYIQKQAGTNADKHNVTVGTQTQSVELLLDKTLTFKLK